MQAKLKEKEFFDNWTGSKDYDVFTPGGYSSIIKVLKKLLGDRLEEGSKLVDLGCGTGNFTVRAAEQLKGKIFGLDISMGAVRRTKAKNADIFCLGGDIEQIAFKDNSFDLVIFSGVLHHFEDLKESLREGYRVLKKNGVLFSYDPNLSNPFMWLYRHQRSPFFSKAGKTENERLLSASEMKIGLEEAGFNKVNAFCISGVTFRYVESAIGRCLLPFYNLFEILFSFSSLAKKYGSFLICYGEK